MAEAKKINGAELKKMIETKETFIVDFYADWCGPCQMFLPVFDETAKKLDVTMVKVNIDDDQQAALEAGVQGIPTVQAYLNGEKKAQNVGFMAPEQLEEFISQNK